MKTIVALICSICVFGNIAMAQQEIPLEAINQNTQIVINAMDESTEFEFGLNGQSVEFLDGFINRNRDSWIETDSVNQVVQNLGSYFGNAILEVHGGQWIVSEEGDFGIEVSERITVFPFSKVRKQINNGSEDSINSLFDVVGAFLKDHEANE